MVAKTIADKSWIQKEKFCATIIVLGLLYSMPKGNGGAFVKPLIGSHPASFCSVGRKCPAL